MNKYFICRKDAEINIWDLDNFTKIWNSKSVSLYFKTSYIYFLEFENYHLNLFLD